MDFNKPDLKVLEEQGMLKDLPAGMSVDEFIKTIPGNDENKDTFSQNEIDDILKLIGG